MTLSNIDTRLGKIETRMRSQTQGKIWVDMKNNVVRIDKLPRRGKVITYPTVYQARRAVEKAIDSHDGAQVGALVDCIWDLYPDAKELKYAVGEVLGGKVIETTLMSPISKDELPGIIFGSIKTGEPASLKLRFLVSQLQYFGMHDFNERYQVKELTEDDIDLYWCLFMVYVWDRPGTPRQLLKSYASLITQIRN